MGFRLLACLLVSSLLGPHARAQSPGEYQVKAVFLYNFAKFVEWPADSSANSHAPIVFGIVGEDPFGNLLEQTIKGKTVNGHELAVKRLKHAQEARGCQIVFIGSSERRRLKPILDELKGASVLTVGETEGFARLGGIINFTLEDNRVHFEVNVDAAERARLKISSRLLSLAKIVRDEGHARKG